MFSNILTIILGIVSFIVAWKIVLGWQNFKMKAAGADVMFFNPKKRLASIGLIGFLIWMILVNVTGNLFSREDRVSAPDITITTADGTVVGSDNTNNRSRNSSGGSQQRITNDITLHHAYAFSEGFAWVVPSDDSVSHLIDTSGNIILTLPASSSPIGAIWRNHSRVNDGLSFVSSPAGDGATEFVIVDTQGNILLRETRNYFNIHLHNAGKFLVSEHVSGFAAQH